jgi:predicted GIY-YIG superfamily endonuclease
MVYSVYKVTNLENGKLYIGYTSKPVLERWKGHVNESRCERKHRAFTRAISKYGEKSFSVEPIYQSLDQEDALEKEVYFISEFQTWDKNTVKQFYKSACADGLADPSLIVLDRSDEMLKCPHCGAEGKFQGMNSHHMDNCKHKVQWKSP